MSAPDPIAPELVERMVALVRNIADPFSALSADVAEAEAIIALLPEPVDPDLVEARRIVHDLHNEDGFPDLRRILEGRFDDDLDYGVPQTLAGIKRGRELASSASK